MSPPRVGIWFIGARGGVAATATVGLIGLQKQLTRTVGLVSELPYFTGVDFAAWPSFVVGGHEIREGTLVEAVDRLRNDSHVFSSALVDACRDELIAIDARIRPGTLANCGDTIGRLAGPVMREFANESAQQAVKRLQGDLRDFQQQNGVERGID
jgi:myo-inositol-1-phosphate synthase